MRIVRFSLLALLALALVLAGCSKQEAPPSPSPTPNPPPKTYGKNKDCKDNQKNCELDTQQVEDEAKMPGHDCASFDDSDAILVVLKGHNPDPDKGKFKGVKIKAKDAGETFDISFTPCDPKNPNPFDNAPATAQTDWTSGNINSAVTYDMKYQMVVVRNKKGGKAKAKKLDPHIVFGG